MFESLLPLAAGSLLTALGVLAKRRIERRGAHELLERRERLLAIHKAMNEQRVSVEDLTQLEAALTSRSAPRALPPAQEPGRLIQEVLSAPGPPMTQAEIIGHAASLADRADEELQQAFVNLRTSLSADRADLLQRSQDAWLALRVAHATYCASEYEGGSMSPLVYHLAFWDLTLKRTTELLKLQTSALPA